MDKSTLLKKGFKITEGISFGIPFTPVFTLDISRERSIKIGSFGAQHEAMYLSEQDGNGSITDIICIHNRLYDGPLTEKKLDLFLSFFA